MSPLTVFVVFSALAALFTGQVWLDYAYARVPVSWGRAYAISAIDWYLWALLTPLVLWLGRRFPFARGRRLGALVVHAPSCLLLAAGKLAAEPTIARRLLGVDRQPTSFLKVYVTLFTYWAILGVGAAVRQARERKAREIQASRLETELARAQLDALKMRLHPHFLFNTLNSISALMREDVEAADVMLTRLSDLLRLTLDRADVQEVPLKEELEFLEKYLEIQQVRFGDRLIVQVDPDPSTLDLLAPSLVLQPLVENALRHGAGQRPGRARVTIRSSRSGDTLTIQVEDDGPGPPSVVQPGQGLETTRARLQHLYGSAGSLTLERGASGGALATLSIPVHDRDRNGAGR